MRDIFSGFPVKRRGGCLSPVYAQPTKNSTPKVEAATPSDVPSNEDIMREIMPRNPVRTECASDLRISRGSREEVGKLRVLGNTAQIHGPAPVVSTEVQREGPAVSTPSSVKEPIEVRSENLFQRTEVLAAVIAGGVIGFLFAIFLILLLVYRMRKKDEGSYDLGERKPAGAAYQKAPTKEFYA
ncbi:hypothetical protein NHX12_023568 [Muraenolepis orangiensis]|uniref:Syndecan n=1 Tax=Muraenolepis orangiensis TaxID=630683 RepID=A0A9Q0ITY2_9TELE|nr:hypothetical protein NHX12_023568 [Muraenolepis orangiensis]